ncbi:hypothetical protein RchiOBHm_Chr2g0172121 [Rosa chinensis]|uniref:Uncharacterized protein n=1 Tax=Rosa chinensis TaxID=74649 RepID=A0A2P6S5J5_ROSCH|nr:sister chromatid cohesion 1 protein 2 isoform X1 [Rosa chinensis]PRQ53942.1 hypothetical protein RchiOBHm_Chr2g0172121 [Rosa chinensis]
MIAPDTIKSILEEDPDPLSVAYDGSPDAKQPYTLGVTTPKLTSVPRPASKKSARISRKRNCVFDDIVVLPNEAIRQSIHDASDLVAKKKEVPKNAHAVWKTNRIGNLAQNFLEPLISSDLTVIFFLIHLLSLFPFWFISCETIHNPISVILLDVSQELRSLSCKRKFRKLRSTPEKLDLLAC